MALRRLLFDHQSRLLWLLLTPLVYRVILTSLVQSVATLKHIALDHPSFGLDRYRFISCFFVFRAYFPYGIVLGIRVIPIIFEKDILEVVVSLRTIEISFNFAHFVQSILFHVQICLVAKRSFIRFMLLADIHIHVVLEHHVYLILKLVYTRHILMHICLIFDGVILSELSTLLFQMGCS